MTDRIHALTVVLDRDIRDDDIRPIIEAIKQIRCVIAVEPHVTDIGDYSARERAKYDIHKRLWAALHEENLDGKKS